MKYTLCAICGKRTNREVFCRSCGRGAQIITASRWWNYPWGYDYGVRVTPRHRTPARRRTGAHPPE
jgi:hypothetical protein